MKDFDGWNSVKKRLHDTRKVPVFKSGEIWWCSVGVNIGFEEDGKNEQYERPVLVLRKYNRELFFGLPLTTVVKKNKFHFVLTNERTKGSIILSQGRIFSTRRMSRKIYTLDSELLDEVVVRHSELLTEKDDKKMRAKKSIPPRDAGVSRVAFASLLEQYSKDGNKSQEGRRRDEI